MTAMRFVTFASLTLASLTFAAGCAPADAASPEDAEASEQSESELAASARKITATAGAGYYAGQPNVARELLESGVGAIPGLLSAAASDSPYAYAATVELSTWSQISTTSSVTFAATPRLTIQVEGASPTRNGRAAKAIYDAMTLVAPKSENGAEVKRSSKGSVACYKYSASYSCFLGPFDNIAAR